MDPELENDSAGPEEGADENLVYIDLEEDANGVSQEQLRQDDEEEAQQTQQVQEKEDDDGERADSSEEEDGDGADDDLTSVDPDYKKYGKRAQKRIQQLVRKNKETEENLQQLQQKLQTAQADKGKVRQLEQSALEQAEQLLQARAELSKERIKKLRESGDEDALFDEEQSLSTINSRREQLNMAKRAWQQQNEGGDDDKEPEADATQQQAAPEPTDRTKKWLRENSWFHSNPVAQAGAMAIHRQLMAEGYDDEDEYFEELDRRVQLEFPHLAENKKQPRGKQVTTGAKRNLGRSEGAASNKNRVALTRTEVDFCKRNGIDPKVYARKKAAKAGDQ